ncbi:MAG: D-alanyl-D-alanine carboxypeptidase [Candidatus Dormibacteraeota bacterium]|nr:D-alanyl-D-alanine carboxypeptidase [Candidatus Dormibacteraeota bacterium]
MWLKVLIPALGLLMVLTFVALYARPLPPVVAQQVITSDVTLGSPPSLAWPLQGEAAVGIGTMGVLESTPGTQPRPTASVAKTMTALLTLEARPMRQGETGPAITITPGDVDVYNQYVDAGGSVTPVEAGEQLTEYQALQALMLPSANNVAVLLADWVAGSQPSFIARMNARAAQLGMTRTHFVDASGFDSGTVSVPEDLVRLGQAAMKNPVLAEIVDQPEATLPVAGLVSNVDQALGLDGIIGIKTGNNDQALGVYLTAARYQVAPGTSVLVVAALQDQASLPAAFDAARTLLRSVRAALNAVRVVSKGETVGMYRAPWGGAVALQAASDLDAVVWPGRTVLLTLQARPALPPLQVGATVGNLYISAGGNPPPVPVVAGASLPNPTAAWRLVPHAIPPPGSRAKPGPEVTA